MNTFDNLIPLLTKLGSDEGPRQRGPVKALALTL